MIQEIQVILRKQIPSEGKYLYRFDGNTYTISTQVYLGKEDTEWDECTEAEKLKYETFNEEILKNEEVS